MPHEQVMNHLSHPRTKDAYANDDSSTKDNSSKNPQSPTNTDSLISDGSSRNDESPTNGLNISYVNLQVINKSSTNGKSYNNYKFCAHLSIDLILISCC